MMRRIIIALLAIGAVVMRPCIAASQPTAVVLMLPGGTSHQMQGIAVARALRARGWRTVMVLATYDALSLASKGLLDPEQQSVVFSVPSDSHDKFEELVSKLQGSPSEFMSIHFAHFESLCRQLLDDTSMLGKLRGMAADIMVLDVSFGCGSALSELLHLPYVLLSPVDVADPFWSVLGRYPYSPAVHGFIGSGYVHPMTFPERAVNALLSPIVHALGTAASKSSAERVSRDYNLTAIGSDDVFHSARLLLVNAAPGVGTPRSLPPMTKMVGPLLVHGEPKPLPPDLNSILEAAGPQGAVYFSFGTAFRPSSCDIIQGLASALASTNRTVVMHIDPTRFPAECPLDSLRLPPRIHVLHWVPQADLLGHPQVKAFVSHGGSNSLYEAAYRGVPMVCLPQAVDQFDGCAKAFKAGWGLQFKSRELTLATAPKLAAMIEQVAADGSPFAQKAAFVSAMFRAHPRPGAERAADWIEYAHALPPGASLLDPAMAMPWWQRNCLDVYMAAAGVLLTVLGAAGLAVWAAWRAMWHKLPSDQALNKKNQ